MVKIVSISDTHLQFGNILDKVPDGDVFIHAGDFSDYGYLEDLKEFDEQLMSLPHPTKIIIPGNHDSCLEKSTVDDIHTILDPSIHLLINKSVTAHGVKFYGSPYVPEFGSWWFQMDKFNLEQNWKKIPQDTDVLITHGPAFGIGDIAYRDTVWGKAEVNCGDFALAQELKRLNLKAHIFGHIHDSYGSRVIDGVKHLNVAGCDSSHELTNKPIVFHI